jgi:hypothetical protein
VTRIWVIQTPKFLSWKDLRNGTGFKYFWETFVTSTCIACIGVYRGRCSPNRRRDESETFPNQPVARLRRQANHLLWTSLQCLFVTVFNAMCLFTVLNAKLFSARINDFSSVWIWVLLNLLIRYCASRHIVALFHTIIWYTHVGAPSHYELIIWYRRLNTHRVPSEVDWTFYFSLELWRVLTHCAWPVVMLQLPGHHKPTKKWTFYLLIIIYCWTNPLLFSFVNKWN